MLANSVHALFDTAHKLPTLLVDSIQLPSGFVLLLFDDFSVVGAHPLTVYYYNVKQYLRVNVNHSNFLGTRTKGFLISTFTSGTGGSITKLLVLLIDIFLLMKPEYVL